MRCLWCEGHDRGGKVSVVRSPVRASRRLRRTPPALVLLELRVVLSGDCGVLPVVWDTTTAASDRRENLARNWNRRGGDRRRRFPHSERRVQRSSDPEVQVGGPCEEDTSKLGAGHRHGDGSSRLGG